MFRRTQVFVGDHIPPAADHIDQLMRRFLLWLNSNEALVMHPVEKISSTYPPHSAKWRGLNFPSRETLNKLC